MTGSAVNISFWHCDQQEVHWFPGVLLLDRFLCHESFVLPSSFLPNCFSYNVIIQSGKIWRCRGTVPHPMLSSTSCHGDLGIVLCELHVHTLGLQWVVPWGALLFEVEVSCVIHLVCLPNRLWMASWLFSAKRERFCMSQRLCLYTWGCHRWGSVLFSQASLETYYEEI